MVGPTLQCYIGVLSRNALIVSNLECWIIHLEKKRGILFGVLCNGVTRNSRGRDPRQYIKVHSCDDFRRIVNCMSLVVTTSDAINACLRCLRCLVQDVGCRRIHRCLRDVALRYQERHSDQQANARFMLLSSVFRRVHNLHVAITSQSCGASNIVTDWHIPS